MKVLTVVAAGRRQAWAVVLLALAFAALLVALPTPEPAERRSSTGLPSSYQSVQAERLQVRLPSARAQPALVVVDRRDRAPLTEADRALLAERSSDLADLAVSGRVPPPTYSEDGTVALLTLPMATADSEQVAGQVERLRDSLGSLPPGLRAQVTGGPAFTADLTAVFEGADVDLLLVTMLVVALLLLLTYRSPVLWIVPLAVVAGAEQTTLRLVDLVLPALSLPADGSTTGITSVLVFGAATDYALLLIARYREELRRTPDRFTAMRAALRRTSEAVLASGVTVVLAVLALVASVVTGNRALGVGAAVGVTVAMVSALVVLPAALVLCGRGLFWPFVPRVGSTGTEGRIWARLGTLAALRPRAVALGAVALLLGLAAGLSGVRVGLSETEQFRVKPEAVLGAETLAGAFAAGTTQPLAVLTDPGAAERVVDAARGTPGVASARVGEIAGQVAQVDVVLASEPGTAASDRTVRELRSTLEDLPGAEAAVGGAVAASLDLKDAAARDARLIMPLILLLVGLVLVVLLRSLLAPALLVLTVVASYAASLGAGWVIFAHLLDMPALDTSVVLLSFVFLVALGVDYNIFLVTRARENALTEGTRAGMLSALRVTGGVITSAGILLAAVFAVLGVLPLITLTQIGVIVCVGVLLDTLLVRTVLVPSLALALGERFWWPGHPGRRDEDGTPGRRTTPPAPAVTPVS